MFLTVGIYAQENGTTMPSKTMLNKQSHSFSMEIKGVSPYTALLILELRQINYSKDSAIFGDICKKYKLIEKNGIYYINSFIIASSNFKYNKYNILRKIDSDEEISTALIPINNIEQIANDENLSYLQIGEPAKLMLDEAIKATWVDSVHQGNGLPQSYFGDGVVVGIIDNGFDYTHPTFYDTLGSTFRIKRVWEQEATIGTPPTGYNYGRELVGQSSILAAQTSSSSHSHGTHVAGISAGGGVGTNGLYRGVAFKSDIVFVATTMQIPAIADGIEYIYNYATSVNKPCVINMSIGGHFGPHDGTSMFDQYCDQKTGAGRLLVGSAGNGGGDPLFINKTFTSTDTILFSFVKFPASSLGTNGQSVIEIWGVQNQNFKVSLNIFNTSNNSFEDYTPYYYANTSATHTDTLYDNDIFSDECIVFTGSEINPLNSKPHILLQVDNTDQDDNYRWALVEIIAYNTQIQMWANSAIFVNNSYNSPMMAGSTNSTVGEIGGTGNSIITVGAYTTKNSYTDFYNNSHNIPVYVSNGSIAPFSSKGPTADGRTKPDITAPGNVIVSSVNSYDNTYTSTSVDVVTGVTNGTKTWWFATMQGTSMSSPMVTGIMALWLEAYPYLTPSQALVNIKSGAYIDSHTGSIPASGNNTWGWGKIDAQYGLIDMINLLPSQPAITPSSAVSFCQGQSATLSAPSGYIDYLWSNGDTTQNITVTTAGNYKVIVLNSQGYASEWSNPKIVTVHSLPSTPSFSINGNILTSSAATGNQWYYNSSIISGAIQQTYTANQSGNYYVKVTNTNNCSSQSSPQYVTVVGIEDTNDDNSSLFDIYPNPNNGIFSISSNLSEQIEINIIDLTGRKLKTLIVNKGINKIDLSDLSQGIYYIRYNSLDKNYVDKIVIE